MKPMTLKEYDKMGPKDIAEPLIYQRVRLALRKREELKTLQRGVTMKVNPNDPAYPRCQHALGTDMRHCRSGMSIRLKIASEQMAVALIQGSDADIARWAFARTDALIEAYNESQEKVNGESEKAKAGSS